MFNDKQFNVPCLIPNEGQAPFHGLLLIAASELLEIKT